MPPSGLKQCATSKLAFLVFILLISIIATPSLAQTTSKQQSSRRVQQQINKIVIDSFTSVHDGWSSDEVILQAELNESFITKCNELIAKIDFGEQPLPSTKDLNWTLMNLRKAGKLKTKTTKRKRVDLAAVRHIAEITTRSLVDKHQCSIDRIMCDANLRKAFDESAQTIDDSVDGYAVRKAAFQLRKARRLRPELISRIADWGRTIKSFSIDQILKDPKVLNEHPGVYIFSDSSGYLYIGQTENLRDRLQKHLDESHNLSLAKYLKTESRDSISIEVHDFDPESQAAKTMVRRAYESELIASRKPRFNVQP
jgi:predicted GIY-YIG superfamily endonuclease